MCVCSSHSTQYIGVILVWQNVVKMEKKKLFWVEIIDILKGGGRTEINIFS